jgi:hypothetical protein
VPQYLVTYRPDDHHEPEVVEADAVDVESGTHVVFGRTQLVIGRPREVVARREVAAGVLSFEEAG